MHMIQHVLLIDIVPILLILGLTKVLLRPATRRLQALERAAGPLAHPVFAVVAYVRVMWVWHVPALYDAALENALVHVIEHIASCSAGAPLLVAPAVPDPLRAAPRPTWAPSSTCSPRSSPSGSWASA